MLILVLGVGQTSDYPHIGSTVQKLPAQMQQSGQTGISSKEYNTQ